LEEIADTRTDDDDHRHASLDVSIGQLVDEADTEEIIQQTTHAES
jgi:hypothetical protein